MKSLVCALLALVSTTFRSHMSPQLEIVAPRHQFTVYQRAAKRPRIQAGDRRRCWDRSFQLYTSV